MLKILLYLFEIGPIPNDESYSPAEALDVKPVFTISNCKCLNFMSFQNK
jgi:hypothetical protein